MGHVLVKEVENKTHIVNLLNVVRPPHITDLQKGSIAERTLLSWAEILQNKLAWKSNWKQVEELKKLLDSVQKKSFIVYEFWTIDQFEVNGVMKETKGCIKFLDCTMYDEMVADRPQNWVPYVELERFASPFEEKVRSKKVLNGLIESGYIEKGAKTQPIYPYEEERLIPVQGRWMGMGFYELLRPEKKAWNKTLNEKLLYDEMLHKGVLVHTKAPFSMNQKGSGRSIESEIVSRIQTGTMISIKAGEKIDRLPIGSLAADFINSADKWFDIARKKAGITEMTMGDRAPGSQSASASVLQQQQGKTTFDIVTEQQGLFFERLFTRFKLESILDEITQEDWVKIVGDADELARLEEPFIENLVNQGIQNAAQNGLIAPQSSQASPEMINQAKTAVRTLRGRYGEERPVQLNKKILDKFDFGARFIVGNEAFDKQAMLNSLQEAINIVSQNPTVGLDVTKLIEKKLDMMDISPISLRKTEQQIQQDRQMAMMAAQGQPNGAKSKPTESMAKRFGQNNQL
jgi:hypothetical protein